MVKVKKIGGSKWVRLSPETLKYLKVNEGDELKIQKEKGKYGNYISIFKVDVKVCQNCDSVIQNNFNLCPFCGKGVNNEHS